jgi:hypothetical protein
MGGAMARFWIDVYQRHFQKHFQKPFDVQVYHDARGFGLKVATFDWALRNRRVYASIGLADKLVEHDEEEFGEVILIADVPDKEVPLLFVNALFFVLQNDIPLGSRFSIGGIAKTQPAFAERYHKTALYFALAGEEDEHVNKVRNGADFGRVYQAHFITAEEDKYLADFGPDEFEKLFAKLGDQRDALRRESCV